MDEFDFNEFECGKIKDENIPKGLVVTGNPQLIALQIRKIKSSGAVTELFLKNAAARTSSRHRSANNNINIFDVTTSRKWRLNEKLFETVA